MDDQYMTEEEVRAVSRILRNLNDLNPEPLGLGDVALLDSNGEDLGTIAYNSNCSAYTFVMKGTDNEFA